MSCDVGEVTESLENQNELIVIVIAELILQPFRHFTYVTAHSPTLPLLHLRHSSFSNPSFASSTSQALHLCHLARRPDTIAVLPPCFTAKVKFLSLSSVFSFIWPSHLKILYLLSSLKTTIFQKSKQRFHFEFGAMSYCSEQEATHSKQKRLPVIRHISRILERFVPLQLKQRVQLFTSSHIMNIAHQK